MPADVGLASRRSADRQETVQAGGRTLLIAGAVVAAVAAIVYLVALATHPMDAMLKGFDLQVYLGGAHEALHHSHSLYSWEFASNGVKHPGIQFTYTPFAALAFAAGLALPFTGLMAVVTIVSLFSLVATIWIAFRQLGWEKTSRLGATMLLSGLLLWTEPVQRALFLGQVELVLMALVVWDLCQPDRRRWKGAATGIAAGIKLVPLLFIAYLLLTRRFRQAAVAGAAFVVTVIIGFIALPNASVTWWLDGNFFQAGRTGFVGSEQNQSLRGIMTRLIGSVNGTVAPWILVAIVVGLLGLAAAVILDQRGYTFAGLMAAALTALLISPISWDHHWVWIAPGPGADRRRRRPGGPGRAARAAGRLVRPRGGRAAAVRRLAGPALEREGGPAPGRADQLRPVSLLPQRRQPRLPRVPLARPPAHPRQPGAAGRPRPVRRRRRGRLPAVPLRSPGLPVAPTPLGSGPLGRCGWPKIPRQIKTVLSNGPG